MKFFKSLSPNKVLFTTALLAAVTLTAGCAATLSVLLPSYDMMAGKVVRLKVDSFGYGKVESSALVHKRLNGAPGLKAYGGVMPPSADVLPYRWVGVMAPGAWKAGTFFGNGPQGRVAVLAADQLPLLHEGDWVDVYVPHKQVIAERRWLTVVRLVCKVEDAACQDREADAAGKPRGQAVAETYDEASISITPHYDMAGNWLPDKQPTRP